MNKPKKPPKFAEYLLRWILPDYTDKDSLGDYEEVFNTIADQRGYKSALLWYLRQILKTIPDVTHEKLISKISMIKNYLQIAIRSFNRHKIYSSINIFGLIMGITSFILLSLYIRFELDYDKFHARSENIYRIATEDQAYLYRNSYKMAQTHPALTLKLKQEFPEIISAARFWINDDIRVSINGDSFYEKDFLYINRDFFEVFSFDMATGSKESIFIDPSSIIISESIAEKYFPGKNPVGLIINFEGTKDFHITGILKNVPQNSHFNIDFLVSEENQRIIFDRDIETWRAIGCYAYIHLDNNTILDELEERISELPGKYFYEDDTQRKRRNISYSLQPITSIHLRSDLNFEIENNGDIRMIYIFSTISILILAIACINYVNLATAISSVRGKEVGIRKVVGATRNQLIKQILFETSIYVVISFLLSAVIAKLILPYYSSILEKDIMISFNESLVLLPGMIILIVVLILLAGSYPAIFISSFNPGIILKKGLSWNSGRSVLRSSLVIIQFTCSIILVLSVLVIGYQMEYLNNKDTGYIRDRIITVGIRDETLIDRISVLKDELSEDHRIVSVSASTRLPCNIDWQYRIHYPGMPDDLFMSMNFCIVDNDFIDLYGLELVEGRKFSDDHPSDKQGAFILNESAMKALNWDPKGEYEFDFYLDGEFKTGKIVGVLKDFHFLSMYEQIQPLYLYSGIGLESFTPRFISIKISDGPIDEILDLISAKFLDLSPDYPFEYSIIDDAYQSAYRTDKQLGAILRIFTIISVVIAGMGLLGLAIFTTEQKFKEIGIRKILGASAGKIMLLLAGEFTIWILISNIIALPAGYYLMNKWLGNFAYKIELNMLIFISAAIMILTVALVTISFQTLKASTANPLDTLSSE